MKKYLTAALVALGLTTAANAITIGNTVGYLLDGKRPYYTLWAGGELISSPSVDHIAALELGYTDDREAGIKTQLMPAMLDYRAQFSVTETWGGYLGLGGGMARTRVSGFGVAAEDWSAAGQGFAGLSIRLYKGFNVDLGARYLRIADVTLAGRKIAGHDDTAVEIGGHLRF